MKLTNRLQAAADLVPVCESMADIGTDHGYLPISLVQEGRARRAIACDVNAGPLARAKEDVISSGLSCQIDLRLGGGLAPLSKSEVDGVTISGMGGLLMRDILLADMEKAQALSWLVLQPQGHVAELRYFLSRHHFRIEKEVLSLDGGQLYELMLVRPGEMAELSMLQAEIGATAAYREDPLFKMHIERLIRRRRFVIEGAKDSVSERHRKSREKALEEVKVLEGYL